MNESKTPAENEDEYVEEAAAAGDAAATAEEDAALADALADIQEAVQEAEDGDAELSQAEEEEEEESPSDLIVRLEAEVAEQKDKLLRALAETENVRRRAERDKADTAKYAIANFARDMLDVADNLRRALDSVDDSQRQDNEAIGTLSTGVEMTEKAMLNAFEQVGITPIEALGQRFDHNLHQALFEADDPAKAAGTVIQVIQAGYMLEDRLLRPAQVGISKGGPKDVAKDVAQNGSKDGAQDGAQIATQDMAEAESGAGSEAETPQSGHADAYERPGGEPGANLDEEL